MVQHAVRISGATGVQERCQGALGVCLEAARTGLGIGLEVPARKEGDPGWPPVLALSTGGHSSAGLRGADGVGHTGRWFGLCRV